MMNCIFQKRVMLDEHKETSSDNNDVFLIYSTIKTKLENSQTTNSNKKSAPHLRYLVNVILHNLRDNPL